MHDKPATTRQSWLKAPVKRGIFAAVLVWSFIGLAFGDPYLPIILCYLIFGLITLAGSLCFLVLPILFVLLQRNLRDWYCRHPWKKAFVLSLGFGLLRAILTLPDVHSFFGSILFSFELILQSMMAPSTTSGQTAANDSYFAFLVVVFGFAVNLAGLSLVNLVWSIDGRSDNRSLPMR